MFVSLSFILCSYVGIVERLNEKKGKEEENKKRMIESFTFLEHLVNGRMCDIILRINERDPNNTKIGLDSIYHRKLCWTTPSSVGDCLIMSFGENLRIWICEGSRHWQELSIFQMHLWSLIEVFIVKCYVKVGAFKNNLHNLRQRLFSGIFFCDIF